MQGYWQGKLDAISVNGQPIGNIHPGSGVIIDTGTTQVIGHTKTVKAVYEQIPGSQNIGNGLWTSMFMSSLFRSNN